MAERQPDAILFTGGFLSQQRKLVPCTTSEFGLTIEDERLFHDFFIMLADTRTFSAVIPGPNFVPLDELYRLSLAAEQEFPNVHVAHATLVETRNLAICVLGLAIEDRALMRADGCSRIAVQYFLHTLEYSERPRKILLLPQSPPGVLGGPEGNAVIGELIDGLRPSLCVVADPTERRGFQRNASTLVVNPGSLSDGTAAWLDWNRPADDQVELLRR